MQSINPANEPQKNEPIHNPEEENSEKLIDKDEVYLVNEDGTPFDASGRTYVAVETPENTSEEPSADGTPDTDE